MPEEDPEGWAGVLAGSSWLDWGDLLSYSRPRLAETCGTTGAGRPGELSSEGGGGISCAGPDLGSFPVATKRGAAAPSIRWSALGANEDELLVPPAFGTPALVKGLEGVKVLLFDPLEAIGER